MKHHGQRAHNVYYSALDGAARNWEMCLNRERYAWAAVELAEWRDPRKDGRPGELQPMQFWVKDNDVVCAGFRKGQSWIDMLDQCADGAQEYDECYVVGWAPLLSLPPGAPK